MYINIYIYIYIYVWNVSACFLGMLSSNPLITSYVNSDLGGTWSNSLRTCWNGVINDHMKQIDHANVCLDLGTNSYSPNIHGAPRDDFHDLNMNNFPFSPATSCRGFMYGLFMCALFSLHLSSDTSLCGLSRKRLTNYWLLTLEIIQLVQKSQSVVS